MLEPQEAERVAAVLRSKADSIRRDVEVYTVRTSPDWQRAEQVIAAAYRDAADLLESRAIEIEALRK